MVQDISNPNAALLHPSYIAHFGIRTTPDKYDDMCEWHCKFFGGRLILKNDMSAMIAFDHEHHRLNIINDSRHEKINKRAASGIYHIAFSVGSLADLVRSYEEKKERGIIPHWPVNHGMSTSMYYFDPDGNEFEMHVDNFDNAHDAHTWMATDEFQQNPIGVDFVIEDFIKRVKSGEPESEIKKRAIIGPRQSRWENSLYFKPEQRFVETK